MLKKGCSGISLMQPDNKEKEGKLLTDKSAPYEALEALEDVVALEAVEAALEDVLDVLLEAVEAALEDVLDVLLEAVEAALEDVLDVLLLEAVEAALEAVEDAFEAVDAAVEAVVDVVALEAVVPDVVEVFGPHATTDIAIRPASVNTAIRFDHFFIIIKNLLSK
jgi:isopropylmalate/homocitrate/citramalate synthase